MFLFNKNGRLIKSRLAMTFIEVAVMIVILSVISSIVGVKLSHSLRDKKFKKSLSQISQLVEMARVQNQFHHKKCQLFFNKEENVFKLSVYESKKDKLKMLFEKNEFTERILLKTIQLPDTIRVERFFKNGFEQLSGGSFEIILDGSRSQKDEFAIQLTSFGSTKYMIIRSNSKIKIVEKYPVEILSGDKK